VKDAAAYQGPDFNRDQIPLLTLGQVIQRMNKRYLWLQNIPGVHHLVDERSQRRPRFLRIPAAPYFGDPFVLCHPKVGQANKDPHLVNKPVWVWL
jgi:hypothetical protein